MNCFDPSCWQRIISSRYTVQIIEADSFQWCGGAQWHNFREWFATAFIERRTTCVIERIRRIELVYRTSNRMYVGAALPPLTKSDRRCCYSLEKMTIRMYRMLEPCVRCLRFLQSAGINIEPCATPGEE